MGDVRERFMALYLEAQPSLRSYCRALMPSAADADDLLQEVSVVLWRRVADYDAERSFLGWSIGIARNQAARWRRSRARSRLAFSAEAEDALARAYEELEDDLAGHRAALRDCIARLGDHGRDLLTQRYAEGLSLAEIAQRRGSSLNAVNKALGKMRRLLLDCAGRSLRVDPEAT
jgi:RNA polymerase sigma-70 factor, ECF subfamily